jgi:hypothetical protein
MDWMRRDPRSSVAREKRVVAATIIRAEDAPGGVDSRCLDMYKICTRYV